MKALWAVCLFLYLCTPSNAQKNLLEQARFDVPFTAKGYLINLYGEYGVWIFQPCQDSSAYVLEALNGQSFLVQDMVNDLGYTWLMDSRGIGRTMVIPFYAQFSGKEVTDTLEYFFCRATINPLDTARRLDSCSYIINYNGKQKGLGCWSLASFVMDMEPLGSEERRRLLEVLHRKRYPKPNWPISEK
jgi:hypothetical protein